MASRPGRSRRSGSASVLNAASHRGDMPTSDMGIGSGEPTRLPRLRGADGRDGGTRWRTLGPHRRHRGRAGSPRRRGQSHARCRAGGGPECDPGRPRFVRRSQPAPKRTDPRTDRRRRAACGSSRTGRGGARRLLDRLAQCSSSFFTTPPPGESVRRDDAVSHRGRGRWPGVVSRRGRRQGCARTRRRRPPKSPSQWTSRQRRSPAPP